MVAFPLVKLGILLVKQISKPLAKSITNRATKSKFFREYFCIPLAQLFHLSDVKIRMKILNLGKVQKVPKLDEKKAIETGAQVRVTFFIFTPPSHPYQRISLLIANYHFLNFLNQNFTY